MTRDGRRRIGDWRAEKHRQAVAHSWREGRRGIDPCLYALPVANLRRITRSLGLGESLIGVGGHQAVS
jgi:hypothetical protein